MRVASKIGGLFPAVGRTAVRWSLAVSIWLAINGTAFAQAPGRVPNEDKGYLQWVVFLGLGVVVCATGFLNPKRSHLN